MSKIKKYIILGIVVILIGASLWFSPTILSYVQSFSNSSSSSSSYVAPYTSLTLRQGINETATLDFGDTEYTFDYSARVGYSVGSLDFSTFIATSDSIRIPQDGDKYSDFGIEVKVSDVSSDSISSYVVILVRPTIQNYMASLHYTEVNLTLNMPSSVSLSSYLTNVTHQYAFWYTVIVNSYQAVNTPQLTIQLGTQEKTFEVYAGGYPAVSGVPTSDFNIDTLVFKIEPNYMIIYVQPLY